MIKTFRGILADGATDKIRLSTKQGKIGYRLIKFEVVNQNPTTENVECVIKIEKVATTASLVIDFSNGGILAVAHYAGSEDSNVNPVTRTIIMDKEIFNQDIYITQIGQGANTDSMNYYLELERINMTDNQAAVSTLRDIRLNPQVGA